MLMTEKAEFTEFYPNENWTKGVCGNYEFEAKVYDVGSNFGINKGRVSKLAIIPKGGSWRDCVVNYDRGWDLKPETLEHKEVLNEILKLCENSSKRFL